MKRLATPAFLLMVILLGLAELGARLFFAQDVSGRFEYGYHPSAGFVARADAVDLVRAGGRRFHPQSFLRHRPPGVFRIFVIGDSVPRGPSFHLGYPWLLGEELRKHGIKAESINMAVPGYGARRCQVVLKKALEYEPSLIILHVNDSNKYEDEREFRRSQEFTGWHPRHWPMKVFIFRRLYEAKIEKVFWNLVPEEIRLKFAANDPGAQLAAATNDPKELAERRWVAQAITAENIALARQHQVPILLVTQCRLGWDSRQIPCLADHGLDAMATLLGGSGVYHLSMKNIFAHIPDFPSYFADSGHLKPPGHLLMAQALCRTIEHERLVPGLAGLKTAAGADRTNAPNPVSGSSGQQSAWNPGSSHPNRLVEKRVRQE